MKSIFCIFALLSAPLAFSSLPPGVTPEPAPSTANGLSGGPFYFELTGSTSGLVWGTDR
ncbi:hypothetical protein HZ994_03620 [Akkermansiaceae bacterium]|nr:hypothetical protein HZ994_03620 [Akkermansiaceae bacterium]